MHKFDNTRSIRGMNSIEEEEDCLDFGDDMGLRLSVTRGTQRLPSVDLAGLEIS